MASKVEFDYADRATEQSLPRWPLAIAIGTVLVVTALFLLYVGLVSGRIEVAALLAIGSPGGLARLRDLPSLAASFLAWFVPQVVTATVVVLLALHGLGAQVDVGLVVLASTSVSVVILAGGLGTAVRNALASRTGWSA